MSDDWAASEKRRKERRELAKNPTPQVTLYRMQGGSPGGSLGIHWTTDENVAHYTGLGGTEGRHVHRAVVNREDIISEGEWIGHNIRSFQRDPKSGEIHKGTTQWGLPSEAEVRLRPGATVREHAVAPQGSHEYEPTGREPTIEARGHRDYIDLAHHAVQGTAEAERLHNIQGVLPHVQPGLFDEVIHRGTGKTLGYTPKFDLMEGDLGQRLDVSMDDVERIVRSAGHDPEEWRHQVKETSATPLADLRSRRAEFQTGHRRADVANPNQASLFSEKER